MNSGNGQASGIEVRHAIDPGLLQPVPQMIAVLDDAITGAHFVVARDLMRREFPATKMVGLRCVPQAADIDGFDSQ